MSLREDIHPQTNFQVFEYLTGSAMYKGPASDKKKRSFKISQNEVFCVHLKEPS